MRVASWVFVLCVALGAVGAFLPSIELQVRGAAIKRAELSLYKMASDRATARRLLAAYRGSSHRRVGAQILRSVSPRVGGRARAALDDARDAMDTLDDVSDDDARLAGRLVVATLCALLGLQAIAAGLVFVELMRGSFRRGRHAAALIAAAMVAAIAIAVHLACREAVWQANDEIGRAALTLGPGAFVIPAAAIAGFLVAVVLVARRDRGPAVTPGRYKRR